MANIEQLADIRFTARFAGLPVNNEFRASWLKAWKWCAFQREHAARGYRREHGKLVSLLAGHPEVKGLGADLWAYPDDPCVTWRLLRALCEAKRAVKPSVAAHYNLGVLAYDGRLDAVIDGEINLLKRQRANIHQIAAE